MLTILAYFWYIAVILSAKLNTLETELPEVLIVIWYSVYETCMGNANSDIYSVIYTTARSLLTLKFLRSFII